MKNFIFNWHKNEKFTAVVDRENKIQASSAQEAVTAFMNRFGNLKINTINFIQEVDEDGAAIGEKITTD